MPVFCFFDKVLITYSIACVVYVYSRNILIHISPFLILFVKITSIVYIFFENRIKSIVFWSKVA